MERKSISLGRQVRFVPYPLDFAGVLTFVLDFGLYCLINKMNNVRIYCKLFIKSFVMQINELREMPSGERARLLAQRASDRKARQDRMTAQRRDMLLDVAQSLLVGGGWERFNLRDMAAKAGYSAGALYAYFDSKDALLRAVRGRWLAELQSAMQTAARPPKVKGVNAKSPADPMAPYQPYLVKMQMWWDAVAKHPLGVSLLLWPIWATAPQDAVIGCIGGYGHVDCRCSWGVAMCS